MGHIYAVLKVTNLFIKNQIDVNMLVDTGATFITLTEQQALQLGFDLDECERRPVTTADGKIHHVPCVLPIEIRFSDNRSYATEALVIGHQALLGVIALEAMDIQIDPKRQTLIANPEHPNYPVSLAMGVRHAKTKST
jgi:clan AA aspartic protease